jgi:hypothetical protein
MQGGLAMNLTLKEEACSCTRAIPCRQRTHYNRRHDISPGSDIHRRVGIRIGNMPTRDTLKVGLGFTVGFLGMTTDATSARGIPRVNIADKGDGSASKSSPQ